jgi:glutaminyl-peptide cyclotransferase
MGLLPTLFVCMTCSGGKAGSTNADMAVSIVVPVITGTIRHDPEAFTQGFLYKDGKLFESTGLTGKSSLRKINPVDGATIYKKDVPDVFAEGLAILGGKMLQLTWREQLAIVYAYPSLKPLGTIHYTGEGWGLTTDTKHYIMSNGSDTLYFRDSAFTIVRKLPVTLRGKPALKLNELEWCRNKVYANVWYTNQILEIDPKTGNTLRIINCDELDRRDKQVAQNDVLNGIAFDSTTGKFYLTGKNWSTIFIVTIPW